MAQKAKGRYQNDSGLFTVYGAGEMNRTPDLLITNEVQPVFSDILRC